MGKIQKYQLEIDGFRENFHNYKNKKIALYGIGRYTATLVPVLREEFCFVALLDRDEENIGKELYGLPIVSLEKAVQLADLIIINTSATYWNLIFRRIKHVDIPIYFLDGKRAEDIDTNSDESNPYWDISSEKIWEKARKYDVVTFDIFDTLIMRKVMYPKDVFQLIDRKIKKGKMLDISFIDARSNVTSEGGIRTIKQIYIELQRNLKLSDEERDYLMHEEMKMERKVCVPRAQMIELCNCIAKEKDVVLISDMYLPTDFVQKMLVGMGLNQDIPIWISAEYGVSKKNGGLWEKLKVEKRGKRYLHIGDDRIGDEQVPKRYGIDTIRILSWAEMWEQSSAGEYLSKMTTLEESLYAGLIGTKMFSDPFILGKTRGKVLFDQFKNMGYVLFGPLIDVFLRKIVERANESALDRICFFARDGYWLLDDYQYLNQLNDDEDWPEVLYLPISRSMVLVSQLGEKNGWDALLEYPYVGKFRNYVKVRLHYDISDNDPHGNKWIGLPGQKEEVEEWIAPYKDDICRRLENEGDVYKSYLKKKDFGEKDAFVDLWFYGNNQYYLSKTLGKRLHGFYIEVDCSEGNECKQENELYGVFNEINSLNKEKSYIRRMAQFVEGFLTAPYGMILSLDENENYVCAPQMGNQNNWDSRVLINEGVKDFIREYEDFGLEPIDTEVINGLWKEFYEEHIDLSKDIKKVFFYDNVLCKEQETKVFE